MNDQSKIAWKRWAAGLWAAASSGVTTAISTNLVAPDTFNVYTKQWWICSAASAGVSAIKYIFRTRFVVDAQGEIEPEGDNEPTTKGQP